ncbi:ATP-grasp domain-containing protein [Actinophytocola sp.]|uniref:ATP-grasp domain-containing protein n=1 Tax=Actinophytocola sp. TaxID=1872138 RepID=UPI003D6BA1A2
MTGAKPRLLVLYDKGSCGPLEIHGSLSPLAGLEFAIGRSEHARQAVPILEGLGTVRPIDDVLDDRAEVPAGGYAGVLTYSERMLDDCSVLIERWDLPGHSTEVVAGLTDKSVQRARLARAGLGDVRSVPARTADEFAAAFAEVGTPCVVKPVRGEGSRQTFRVLDPDEARRLTGELTAEPGGTAPEHYVVEEMLRGEEPGPFADYVSVETISRAGVHRTVGVTSKFPLAEPFRETGQLWPCHRPVSWQAEIERSSATCSTRSACAGE